MTALPEPLTPAVCDLRDFTFMPLDVVRLRDSDIAAKSNGDEFRCAVLLWCASWHQVPAASLPDDDEVLAQLAGFGRVVKEWMKVRTGTLHGWIKCSDGRLYHPVVAEKANEAWAGRLKYAEKKETDRNRKAEERRLKKLQEDAAAAIAEEAMRRSGSPHDVQCLSSGQSQDVRRTYLGYPPENSLKETVDSGQRQRQFKEKPEPPPPASTEVGATELTAPAPTRVGQVSILLRGYGVMVTPHILAQPQHAWISDARATDELLHLAVAEAKESNPTGRLNANYLAPIIHRLLNPPPPRKSRDDGGWRRTPAGIEAKGRELGMFARGGESHDSFAHRIQAEIDKRKGSTP